MSVYRLVWAGCAIGLILTGGTLAVLALTPGLVVLAISVSLLSGGLVGMITGPHETPTLRGQRPAAAAAFTMVIVGAGLGGLAGPLGPAAMVLLVVLSPAALRWYAGLRRTDPDGERNNPARSTSTSHSRESTLNNVTTSSLGPMTDHELCLTWRRSFVALQRASGATDHLSIVQARGACLDELQRRDPVGFACWMAAGARAASDPARYLGSHPSRG